MKIFALILLAVLVALLTILATKVYELRDERDRLSIENRSLVFLNIAEEKKIKRSRQELDAAELSWKNVSEQYRMLADSQGLVLPEDINDILYSEE